MTPGIVALVCLAVNYAINTLRTDYHPDRAIR